MHNTDLMNRQDVITRIKSVEPSLRASGVGALYRFGSYGRDEARPDSDIDIFVEAAVPAFYNLSNYMGAYATLSDVFPNKDIGLLDTIRPVEIHTRSSRTRCCAGFLMAASKNPLTRLVHRRDEILDLSSALDGLDFGAVESSYLHRRTTEHAILINSEAVKALSPTFTDHHEGVDWRAVRDVGNFLRHAYFAVDPEILWRIVKDACPSCRP